VWVVLDERRICLKHAARSVGVTTQSVKQRARKIAETLGVDYASRRIELLELALEHYKQNGKGRATARGKKVMLDGRAMRVSEAAAVLGVTVNAIRTRMWRRGCDAQAAVDHYVARAL
jgi:hypothetical protein